MKTVLGRQGMCFGALLCSMFFCLSAAAQVLLTPVELAPSLSPQEASVSAPRPLGPLNVLTPDSGPQEDPARWTQEDTTHAEQLETARKEARAAFQVSVDLCKLMPAGEQPPCMQQARQDFAQEMRIINTRFGVPN